jgi:hypothetical protein
MVEWACAILVELVMLLAQVVGGAGASCRVKLPVPRQLALILITRRRNTWGRRLRRGRGRGIHTYRPDSPVQESVIATQGSCRGYLPATARVYLVDVKKEMLKSNLPTTEGHDVVDDLDQKRACNYCIG